MPRYLIGIDLGTTNSALAYIDLHRPPEAGRSGIETFPVLQLVAPAEVGTRPLLPSFLYLPGAYDLPAGATALPWDPARRYAVGEFARQHGAKVPGRLVTSAKSWLCHAGVDRSAPLLPWSAPADVPRISPVEASARYLRHLVESWNYAHPGDRLEEQPVVLTVPASFDDVARNLTVEAARQAGIERLTLLEEPQAAFYCWLATHPPAELQALKPGARCLVVDVGGGTSDFGLIQAVEREGDLGFVRQAVGDHLLLGGDNMDLALAKFVETKLPGAGRLDAVQYGLLTQACRSAKETLLAAEPSASLTVTVVGRGRQVVGGTQHATLTGAEVRQLLFDGFFPLVPREAEPIRGPRTGLHEMGLPYVADPAISRHLALFLRRHLGSDGPPPDAVLFNGGVFQAAALRARLLEVVHHWYDTGQRPWRPLVLTNPSLDLAVAWGAAYFGWLRHSGGRRIGGGLARSYYIAVGAQGPPPAAPAADGQTPLAVLCVLPQHLEEGQELTIDQPELELTLGQPVAFPLYTSTVRGDDRAGDLLTVAPDQLRRLPPLHTVLRGGKRSGTKHVPVTLAARCTDIGTLELWCVAKEGQNRWRLEFNVRDVLPEETDSPAGPPARPGVTDVWPEEQVQQAGALIRATFDSNSGPAPQELTKALEAALGAPRQDWPTGLCRRLWEFLGEQAEQRRKSPAHLSRWYHLVGWSLRPGFGDPLDPYRIETLWKMMHAPPRSPQTTRQPEGGADYWIMWRRVAGGLPAPLQTALADRLRPALLTGKGKGGVKPLANELAEMWRAAASLERLDVKTKEALGQALLKPLRRSPVPTYAFWALTRLGARVLLYGPLNAVVHPQVVEGWIDALLPFQPGHDSERLAWAFCLAQLARRSGQRALDVDERHREGVLSVLRGQALPEHWLRMVEEVTEWETEEQSQMFGDALPVGLRLRSRGDEASTS
ncbi:MAG: hsp70 family protein [Gemmataceae bacterium]|nr:hsp70 family protein [Gemmataceae bacterium]MDW8266853.1 Hsp70 family protein [Gemmataceae bacterium]